MKKATLLPLALTLSLFLPASRRLHQLPAWPAPMPSPDVLDPVSEAEANVHATVLWDHHYLEGKTPAMKDLHYIRRLRLTAFDEEGVEKLSHLTFERLAFVKLVKWRGQVTTPNGKVFPLLPEKDMHEVKVKRGVKKRRRKKETVVERVFTPPHLSPGAILDLEMEYEHGAWLSRVFHDWSLLIQVEEIPTRKGFVLSKFKNDRDHSFPMYYLTGQFDRSATLTQEGPHAFRLDFADLSPSTESYAPPKLLRDGWLLMSSKDDQSGALKRFLLQKKDLVMRLGPYGLLKFPDWAPWAPRFQFSEYQQKQLSAVESKAEVLRIAPANLPLEERVRKLYDHVHSRLRYSLAGATFETLKKCLKEGMGID